jgi:hypothetical protein
VGKITSAVLLLSREIFRLRKIFDKTPSKEWPAEVNTFVGGLVGGSMLTGKTPLYEYYAGLSSKISFSLSAGVVAIGAACIPGDGSFRFAEAAAGVVLIAAGVCAAREEDQMVAGMLGAMLGNVLSSVPLEKLLSNSATILKVWSAISTAVAAIKTKGDSTPEPKPEFSSASSPSPPEPAASGNATPTP